MLYAMTIKVPEGRICHKPHALAWGREVWAKCVREGRFVPYCALQVMTEIVISRNLQKRDKYVIFADKTEIYGEETDIPDWRARFQVAA